jgi:hypothetical protein
MKTPKHKQIFAVTSSAAGIDEEAYESEKNHSVESKRKTCTQQRHEPRPEAQIMRTNPQFQCRAALGTLGRGQATQVVRADRTRGVVHRQVLTKQLFRRGLFRCGWFLVRFHVSYGNGSVGAMPLEQPLRAAVSARRIAPTAHDVQVTVLLNTTGSRIVLAWP